MKKNNGITLIALVITIIVLLILAGVSIAMLGGTNGILGKTSDAKGNSAIADVKDEIALAMNEAMADYYDLAYVDGNTTVLTAGKLSYMTTNVFDKMETKYAETAGEAVKVVVVDPTGTGGPATAGSITITLLSDTSKSSTATIDADGNIGAWNDTGF